MLCVIPGSLSAFLSTKMTISVGSLALEESRDGTKQYKAVDLLRRLRKMDTAILILKKKKKKKIHKISSLGRHWHRVEDNIRNDVKETVKYNDVEWMRE